MPKRILDPYFRYIDNLNIKFQIGKTIGKGHVDRCSVPQGCPFSMTMVALLLVPWIKAMKEIKVVPRVLADDLMFTANGSGHRAKTIQAMKLSRQFFVEIGAKVADNKCFTFSNDTSTSDFLSNYIWDAKGLAIPCHNNFRDLGTHLNLSQTNNGSTLTIRINKATRMAKKLRWMPISREQKEKIVLCNILPAALYGCEAAHVNKTALNSLRSAIAFAIGPASAKRCVNLVFTNSRCAKDLDPAAHILYLRVAGIRRIMAKHSEEEEKIRFTVKRYNTKNVNNHPSNEQTSQPIWPPELIVDKDNIEHDYGPIGFLLASLRSCDCTMSDDLSIRSENEADIDLWNMPWQHLKTAVINIATRQRTRNITSGKNARTFCGNAYSERLI